MYNRRNTFAADIWNRIPDGKLKTTGFNYLREICELKLRRVKLKKSSSNPEDENNFNRLRDSFQQLKRFKVKTTLTCDA